MNKQVLLWLVVCVSILAFFLAIYMYSQVHYSQASHKEKEVFIYIKKGSSVSQMAKLLKNHSLLTSEWYFKFLVWLQGVEKQLQAGEYKFSSHETTKKMIHMLKNGKTHLHKVTFPEGYNLYEMGKLLHQESFLNQESFILAAHDSSLILELLNKKLSSLEGYLFPDTYYIPRPVVAQYLIKKMVKRFFEVYSAQDQTLIPMKLNQNQIVILASIVEKETGQAVERPLIASVFFNRLKKGMRLESDPTIIYGMIKENKEFPINIRKKDLLRKTPYNTYRINGLPIGPITNPGEGALRAVFQPKKSSYLYFVSRNDGTHVFSETYQDHQKAVNYYQKFLRGKKPSLKPRRKRIQ